jgi:FdhD protein/phenylacetyl-CoA:acceptor oxidoreductase accessory protein
MSRRATSHLDPHAQVVALLALLAGSDGVPLPAAAKRLGVGQSELRRLLATLGNDPALPGPGLVETQEDGERTRVWLTAAGRAFCAASMPAGAESGEVAIEPVSAVRIEGDERRGFADEVIAEAPIALLYNGLAFAVMLATPADLEDFALGFSLSEGIVTGADEWSLLERVDTTDGITLDMAIPQARADALEERRRGLAGRSGCGLCGVESLQAALPPIAHLERGAPVPAAHVRDALAQLAGRQPLNHRSGGVHAAAFVHDGGLLVREDVGRHNALDKVLGARARAGVRDGFIVVTSRASVEMVHKTATLGIGMLVAISAPTSLAIALAEQAGLTLVAFARGESMTVYTHPDGIG